jgi:hypothetical protein
MATWTEIPQSSIEPEKPIKASDIWAIYQNILALAEGANGAPKIMAAALQKASNLAAGTAVCSANKSMAGFTGFNVKGYSFIIFGSGTLRFNTSFSSNNSGVTLNGQWYKNNVAIGSSFTASGSQDFAVSPNDIFTLQVNVAGSTIVTGYGGTAVSYLSCNSVGLLPLIAI